MVATMDDAVEEVHAERVVWTLEEDDIWSDCPEGERKPSARGLSVSLPAQSTVVTQEGPPKKPEGHRSVTGTWVADVSPERSSSGDLAGIASSSQPFAQTGRGSSKRQGIPENNSKFAAGNRPATRVGQENKSPPSLRGAQSERAPRHINRATGRFSNVGNHERAARQRHKKTQQQNGYARFLEGQWVVQQGGKQPEAEWRNWVSRGAVPAEPSAPSMRYHSAPGGRRTEPDAAGRARRMAGCSMNRIPTQLAAAVRVGHVAPAWTRVDKSAASKEKLPKVYKPQPPPKHGSSKEGSREQSQLIAGSKRVSRSVAAAQAAALHMVQNPPLQPQVSESRLNMPARPETPTPVLSTSPPASRPLPPSKLGSQKRGASSPPSSPSRPHRVNAVNGFGRCVRSQHDLQIPGRIGNLAVRAPTDGATNIPDATVATDQLLFNQPPEKIYLCALADFEAVVREMVPSYTQKTALLQVILDLQKRREELEEKDKGEPLLREERQFMNMLAIGNLDEKLRYLEKALDLQVKQGKVTEYEQYMLLGQLKDEMYQLDIQIGKSKGATSLKLEQRRDLLQKKFQHLRSCRVISVNVHLDMMKTRPGWFVQKLTSQSKPFTRSRKEKGSDH